MAIDAKMSFIAQLYTGMAGVLTVEQAEKMKAEAMEILDHFEMTETDMAAGEKDNMLQYFIAAMQVENKSAATIRQYQYALKRMLDYVKIPTRRISVHHLRNYLAEEKTRGLADATLENERQIFCAYFGWLQREGLIDHNPTSNLGVIRIEKKQRKSLSKVEIEKLNRKANCVRDRAIIRFLLSTGCRISEMCGLNREDVDLEKLECTVHGKGAKQRTVYLDEVAGMLIKEYLSGRTDENEALFTSYKRERLQPNGVRIMLKKLGKKAGVEHVHPHKFRRTRATEMARRGMPLQEVAKMLGHEKIDTTMKYVNQTDESVRATYRRLA